jgi:uncharacterized membrane protein SirB2
MNAFTVLLMFHIMLAIVSPILFSLRAWRAIEGLDPGEGVLRWLPHAVDTALFGAGATLAWLLYQVPGQAPWLTAKLTAVVLYIVIGHLAVRRARTRRLRMALWAVAMCVLLYVYAVAFTLSPSAGLLG